MSKFSLFVSPCLDWDLISWSQYAVDNIKKIFFSTDFVSFIDSVSHIFLYHLLLGLALGIIIFMENIVDLATKWNAKKIEEWKPITIPVDRKYDLFYLKLGYQCVRNTINSKDLSVYSRNWARWSRLSKKEITRLHNAALNAESTGSLSKCGYSFCHDKNYKDFVNRITYVKNRTCLVRSDMKFLDVISSHDLEKGS